MSLRWVDGRLEPMPEPAGNRSGSFEAAIPGHPTGVPATGDRHRAPGTGLFETIRVEEGEPCRLGLHLDRLVGGLHRLALRIPESRRELSRAVCAVAAEAPRPLARLRIVVARRDPGDPPARSVVARAWDPPSGAEYREGVAAVVDGERRLSSRRPDVGLKSLSRDLYRDSRRAAERRGAWESLLVNEHGRLVEGTRTNLVVVRGGRVLTPPEDDGALPGTVRRSLLEAGVLREGRLRPDDLSEADEILLTNALVEVLPVSSIDGRSVAVGPVATELRRELR